MDLYLACSHGADIRRELTHYHSLLFNPVIDEAHNTILHYFAYDDQSDEIRYLLDQGIPLNLTNKNGETALHWASKMGSIRAATALVNGGIDVDIQDISGSTALHCAIENGIPELIPVLIGAGCNSLIADGDGKIPLDIANENADISSDYFATQLMLERTTTIPANKPENGNFKVDIRKGDIVFVNRQNYESSKVASKSDPQTPAASGDRAEAALVRSRSAQPARTAAASIAVSTTTGNNAAASKPAVGRPSSSPAARLQLSEAEAEALQLWKKKKMEMEEAKRTTKPPFYSRAALPIAIDGALDIKGSSSNKVLRSASESVLQPVAGTTTNHIEMSKTHTGRERSSSPARNSNSASTRNHPTAGNKAPANAASAIASSVHPSYVCYEVEPTPSSRLPTIWSRISKIPHGCDSLTLPTPPPSLLPGAVDISSLLEMDNATASNRSSSPSKFKPLWGVNNSIVRPASGSGRDSSPSTATQTATKVTPEPTEVNHYLPFLPSDRYARCLDVYITVEQCHNCTDHRWLAWHDEDEYNRKATDALKTTLAAIAECGFPVRVFAFKVHADHTRLASLELNIAIRVSNGPPASSSRRSGGAPLTECLKWLKELSSMSSDQSRPQSSEYERMRAAGLHGDTWLSANLHSKLNSTRWPSKRKLQMKTVVFLATALCGQEFAQEYAKLLFFDRADQRGRGIGLFRKEIKKPKDKSTDKKKSQAVVLPTAVVSESTMSHQIDVVQLFGQWSTIIAERERVAEEQRKSQELYYGEAREDGTVGSPKMGNRKRTFTSENLTATLAHVEERRSIRTKLTESLSTWEAKMKARVPKPTATATVIEASPEIARRTSAAVQMASVTAYLAKRSADGDKSDKVREFMSWGQFFDPTLVLYHSNHKSSSGSATVLGPSAVSIMPRVQVPGAASTKTIATATKTAGTVPNSVLSAVHALTTRPPLEIDIAQLHALWLYFVMDHTPCAATEYVPPFAAMVTAVVAADKVEVSPAAAALESTDVVPQRRITQRINRKQSEVKGPEIIQFGVVSAAIPSYLASFESPSKVASASSLTLSPFNSPGEELAGLNIGLNGRPSSAFPYIPDPVLSYGPASSNPQPTSQPRNSRARVSILQRVEPEASSQPVGHASRSTSTSLAMSGPFQSPAVRTAPPELDEDDLLEMEYTTLLQMRFQQDTTVAELKSSDTEPHPPPNMGVDAAISEEDDDDEEVEDRNHRRNQHDSRHHSHSHDHSHKQQHLQQQQQPHHHQQQSHHTSEQRTRHDEQSPSRRASTANSSSKQQVTSASTTPSSSAKYPGRGDGKASRSPSNAGQTSTGLAGTSSRSSSIIAKKISSPPKSESIKLNAAAAKLVAVATAQAGSRNGSISNENPVFEQSHTDSQCLETSLPLLETSDVRSSDLGSDRMSEPDTAGESSPASPARISRLASGRSAASPISRLGSIGNTGTAMARLASGRESIAMAHPMASGLMAQKPAASPEAEEGPRGSAGGSSGFDADTGAGSPLKPSEIMAASSPEGKAELIRASSQDDSSVTGGHRPSVNKTRVNSVVRSSKV